MRQTDTNPERQDPGRERTTVLTAPLRFSHTARLPSFHSRKTALVADRQAAVPVGYTPLSEVERFAPDPHGDYDHQAQRRRRWFDLDRRLGFLLIVVAPALLAIAYYGTVAAPRFVSESKFILRSSGGGNDMAAIAAAVGAPGSGPANVGMAAGGDRNAQAVAIYIDSFDGMAAADRTLRLRDVFGRPEADWLSRYPGPFQAETTYGLHRYWQRMLTVQYDPTTGVIRLKVSAFRPEDSKAIGEAVLASAEALVNRMDLRARQEALRVAQEQVELAREQVARSQDKMMAFRLREQVVDPVKMSGVVIETIAQLVVKSTFLKAELSNMLQNMPASTQASLLRSQIASIETEITAQQRKLTGRNGSLSPLLAEYARLSLQSEFANRTYTATLEQMESARATAGRQQVYLERISGPTLSDYATEPRSTLMILLVFALAFCAWSLLRFVLRNVRAHHGR